MWLDPKNFSGETLDMNGNLFQTIEESRDVIQYIKTIEALERYAFKTYKVDLSALFQRDKPEMPIIKIPTKSTEDEIDENLTLEDLYQLRLKEYIKDKKNLVVALKSIWAIVWGQCSNAVHTKLEKKRILMI